MCYQFIQENKKQSNIEMKKVNCSILIVKLQVVNNVMQGNATKSRLNTVVNIS